MKIMKIMKDQVGFQLAVMAFLCATLPSAVLGQSGEDACEDQKFNEEQCLAVGCCEWDDAMCWSAVGTKDCTGGGGGGGGGPLLVDLEGWVDGKVKWHTPPSGWGSCGAVTTVYGVAICVSKAAWKKNETARTKATHIAQVFYQLIDNDADGVPDDPVHLKHMVDNGYLLWVPLTDKDSKNSGNWPDEVGVDQMTGIFEAVPGTCDSPANRGADPKDRTTWAAVVENTQGCDPERDATTEEIHHLMATAAGELWPDLWEASFKSEAGKAIELTNGNCGWGFKNNWIDPSSNKCEGQYAYNDKTCDEACIVVEGIYWASVSYIGGLYTKTGTDDAKNEWLMATPNDGMTIYPKSVINAKTLETGSPALYKLVSTTETESGHKWLPAIMPDGKYMGKQTAPVVAPVTAPVTAPVGAPSEDEEDEDEEDEGECADSPFRMKIGRNKRPCDWVGTGRRKERRCARNGVESHCPASCGECEFFECSDSDKKFKIPNVAGWVTCDMVSEDDEYCEIEGVAETCKDTCGYCD